MRKKTNGAKGTFLCLALLAAAAAGPLQAQETGARTVTVKVAADRSIENMAEWRIAVTRLLRDGFRAFHERLGIRLVVENIVTWDPGKGRKTLLESLGTLRKRVVPGACDVVLGIVSPEHIDGATLGIASYPFGYMLIKNVASREAMLYALLHETCHLFGAVDLREKGSIMGIEQPGFGIDVFTARVVALNKDRTFGGSGFPLPNSGLRGVAELFSGRAGMNLEEPEIHLFLTLFYLEMNQVDAAAEACAEAVREDPGFAGLYVLLGNISLKQGAADRAIEEYRKALESQPGEAGIYFNIGLALIQKGNLAAARSEFEKALEIHPGFAQARQAVDRLRQAETLNAGVNLGLEPVPVSARAGK